eukprot:gene46125-61673_t
MSDTVHDTFVIARTYPTTTDRVFAAFADAAKRRRWFAEGGHGTNESYELDFREGGLERSVSRMGDNTPFPGVALVSENRHQDIVPNRRIVLAQTMMMGERRISAAQVSFQLSADGDVTTLTLTHQAAFFEGADGPEIPVQATAHDRLFHALGDPTRRAILSRLSKAPASISTLAEPLGVTLTAVS